jgi:hypothetical protein
MNRQCDGSYQRPQYGGNIKANPKAKGKCAKCNRWVALLKNGNLRPHVPQPTQASRLWQERHRKGQIRESTAWRPSGSLRVVLRWWFDAVGADAFGAFREGWDKPPKIAPGPGPSTREALAEPLRAVGPRSEDPRTSPRGRSRATGTIQARYEEGEGR